MNKPSNKVKGEHGFWMVRILDKYWALTRNNDFKIGTNLNSMLLLRYFYTQVGPSLGLNYGLLLNYDCDHAKYPANGDCQKFWKYWNPGLFGGRFQEDKTITFTCKN